MASLNRVMIIGNLGQDPELRYTQNQTAVTTMNVATTDVRTGPDGQRQDLTEWHRIVVWAKQAENCAKYLSKGRSVYVEGRLQTRSWEDKTGAKRYTTEIVAQNVQFLGGAQQARDISQIQQQQQQQFGGYTNQEGQASDGGYNPQGQQPTGNNPLSSIPNAGFGGPDTANLDDIPF